MGSRNMRGCMFGVLSREWLHQPVLYAHHLCINIALMGYQSVHITYSQYTIPGLRYIAPPLVAAHESNLVLCDEIRERA